MTARRRPLRPEVRAVLEELREEHEHGLVVERRLAYYAGPPSDPSHVTPRERELLSGLAHLEELEQLTRT